MMSELDKNAPITFAKGYRYQWEPAQELHVLLYPEGLIKLNTTASLILGQIDGVRSVNEIIELLSKQYPNADVKADIEAFLATAYEKRWIAFVSESC